MKLNNTLLDFYYSYSYNRYYLIEQCYIVVIYISTLILNIPVNELLIAIIANVTAIIYHEHCLLHAEIHVMEYISYR